MKPLPVGRTEAEGVAVEIRRIRLKTAPLYRAVERGVGVEGAKARIAELEAPLAGLEAKLKSLSPKPAKRTSRKQD